MNMNPTQQQPAGLEITTFKLRTGDTEGFIKTNIEIDDWLKKQPGFQSRQIAVKEDGTIVDILAWNTVNDATAAMHGIMTEMAHSNVHELIDQSTVCWNVYPVYHSIT
jgi:hypothetical protein